ncbi:DUF1295 domain-containing protein [Alphaproteobacteria bacterium GH1-50]|uniref:DUF1295 domain-containing protein n=1 Tax=Kangsaoukella pontilimi TaxID=2691042 RepID=A0A7C9J195_9RHOB|nr:isoprenylcysteine carboxylmethyltransferase family protein [Kangsaoukella pontilimi]MXQ06661.1 DUF1295 domain-containing protein [Kangsaoukella pontilimi]
MKKTLDYPPVWLAAFVLLSIYTGPGWGHVATTLGWTLIASGLVLTLAAAAEFRKHRTTIVPHQTPESLVTTGVYAQSRNPIYLADVLILAGVAIWTGSIPGILSLPVLFLVLERRFILPEEARMAEKFGEEFEAYTRATRRWF